MSLYLETQMVHGNKGMEKVIKDLESLFAFDLDHSGHNGIEFCWEQTELSGCKSDIEYLVKKFLKDEQVEGETLEETLSYVNVDDLICYVVEKIFDNDSWYTDYKYSVEQFEDSTYYVSIACETDC